MKREDRKNVASVIDANSQWVALQQLVSEGKSHVRVISKKKTLQLIEAVVDDAIRRGTVKLVDADRDRIVAEANDQFNRVSRIQAESESLIRQQKELLARQQIQIQQLEQAEVELKKQIEADRHPNEAQERTTRLQAQALEAAQKNLQEAAQRQRKSDLALKRLDRRMNKARETVINYDREIDRLGGQVKQDALLIEQLRSQLREREHELGRVKGLMEALGDEVSSARASRSSTEPDSIRDLRSEFAQMKTFLKSLEQRSSQADRSTLAAMLERISQKEAAAKAQLEDSFQNKLNDTLDQIGQAVRVATARAVDRPVEATDVYISKVFDDEAIESNLDSIDVQVTTAKQSISKNLERLKELRSEASQVMEDPDPQQEQNAGGP